MTKPKKSNLKKSIDTDEVAIFLSGIKIFQHLDYDVIVDIAGSMTNESFISGDLLIKRGVSGTKMYIVWAGDVLVEVGDDRRGVAKEISLRRGAVIGEISMLSGKKLTANVIAKSNVIALSLNRESFHKLIRQHESFANALSELMSTRLVEENGIREVGKYKITAKIGEGGMSIVYNAIDPELERDVAIKMLKHQIASRPEVLANFNQEAKIIAQLKHPNIVNVLEMIDAYSTRFIIMEKVDGINLRQYLKKYGVFQPAQTCKIIKELAKALEYAHKLGEKGIIHRDIKPANVIMDPQGNIKLMDFGIAGPAGTADTVVGTPAYMAPEIIKRKTTDGRSDIYALGILAYEMMTGKPPFIGNNFTQTLSMHLNNPPPKLQAGNSELCQGLAHFIGRALVKNPAQRIDNWTEIQQLLRPDATANSAEQSLNSYNDFGIFIRVHEPTKDNINKLKIDIENALSPSQISHSIQPLIPNSLSLEEMKKIDDQADSIASAMTMIDL